MAEYVSKHSRVVVRMLPGAAVQAARAPALAKAAGVDLAARAGEIEGAVGDLAERSGGLFAQVAEGAEEGAAEAAGATQPATAARARPRPRRSRSLFAWAASFVGTLAKRIFVAVFAVDVVKHALQRINLAAQGSRDWRAMTDAGLRLVDSFTRGVLGSQLVQGLLVGVARRLETAAGSIETGTTSALAWAARHWDTAVRALEPFLALAQDFAEVQVLKFQAGLLDFAASIKEVAEIRVRSLAGASTVTRDPARPDVVAIMSFPGSGIQSTEPQNRIFGDAGTAQPVGLKAEVLDLFGVLDVQRETLAGRLRAAEERLTGRARAAFGLPGGPPGSRGAAGTPAPTTPEQAAEDAARTGVRSLLDSLRKWSVGGPGSAIHTGLMAIVGGAERRLSAMFEGVKGTLASLRAHIAITDAALAPVIASTEALAGAFEAVALQVEAIAASSGRAQKVLARIELLAIAVAAAVQAGIEVAAGIAAAIGLNVAQAILHFAAATTFSATAAIASGRAAGVIRSPEEARDIAQGRLDRIRGGPGGASRSGRLVLVVHGDTDLEDEEWLRKNVLRPIASAGAVPPEDGGFTIPNVNARRPTLGQAIQAAVEGRWNSTYGGKAGRRGLAGLLAGFAVAGPIGGTAGYFLGRYHPIAMELQRATARATNEARRFRRRLRRVF